MPTLQLELSPDELLKAVSQMDAAELDDFTARVLALRARRATSLPTDEVELIRQINQGVPSDIQKRFDQLVTRRWAEVLTEDEYQELLALTEQIERIDADRLERIAQLAHVRGIPLREMIRQLGLKQHPHD
jgi:hypothetical protein